MAVHTLILVARAFHIVSSVVWAGFVMLVGFWFVGPAVDGGPERSRRLRQAMVNRGARVVAPAALVSLASGIYLFRSLHGGGWSRAEFALAFGGFAAVLRFSPERSAAVPADGIEKTFATSCLAPFLLTHLLLDLLEAAPAGRIVNIASVLHKGDASFLDDLQSEKSYNFLRAYRFSKLGVILMTYEMARRLKDSRVTVNCVEPGPTRTRFGDNMRGLPAIFPALMKRMPFFRSAEDNTRALVFLASAPALARTTGQYFVKTKPARSAPITHDCAVAARHWAICEQLTGLQAHGEGAAESLGGVSKAMRVR